MPDTDIKRILARLARLRTDDHRIITCYLKIEPRDCARGKYLVKLKNRVREVEGALEALGLDRRIRDEVSADLRRLVDQLREPARLPNTQGLAVFLSGPLKLFEVVPLPSVHRSRLAVDRTPLVRELAKEGVRLNITARRGA